MSAAIMYKAKSAPGLQKTASGQWKPINGLSMTLPAAGNNFQIACVILNLTGPYVTGSSFPGAEFTVTVNGQLIPDHFAIAVFGSANKEVYPGGAAIRPARVPTTLVGLIGLALGTQLQAVWRSVNGATVVIDTPCTMTAIFGKI